MKNNPVDWSLIALAVLPHLLSAFGNNNTILDWFSSDDGFYYFQMARNLAAGQGFTFDGITQSNGFHPLWLLLITPVFALAQVNLLLPLRVLVLVLALISGLSAVLLYRIGRRSLPTALAMLPAILWIALPRIHTLTIKSGVEAGINALMILLFWERLTALDLNEINKRNAVGRLAPLGLLATLVLLARLDNLFLVFFGGLWLWLRLWQPPAGKDGWRWRLRTGLAFFAPITAIMLIYLAWSKLAFGTFSPVSGQIKVWWGTLRNTVYGFPVRRFETFLGQFVTGDEELGPWSLLTGPLYAGAESLLTAMGQGASLAARRLVLLAGGGLLALGGAALAWPRRRLAWAAVRRLGLPYFFAGVLAQIIYYKASGSVAQQPWYWVSERIFLLLALGVLLGLLLEWAEARSWQRALKATAILLIALGGLNFLAYVADGQRAAGDGSNHFYLERPAWLEEHTEKGARIAITGAGNLGYFSEGRIIINMDGLMNSYEYFEQLQAGNGANYLAELGVDYVFGNEYVYTKTNPYGPMLEGHLERVDAYKFGDDREHVLWRFVP